MPLFARCAVIERLSSRLKIHGELSPNKMKLKKLALFKSLNVMLFLRCLK